jgi:hypothetical protein
VIGITSAPVCQNGVDAVVALEYRFGFGVGVGIGGCDGEVLVESDWDIFVERGYVFTRCLCGGGWCEEALVVRRYTWCGLLLGGEMLGGEMLGGEMIGRCFVAGV